LYRFYQGVSNPYAIHAKPKSVPFEYVDALHGQQPGPYVIADALIVTD
jgi:hypothetical protein